MDHNNLASVIASSIALTLTAATISALAFQLLRPKSSPATSEQTPETDQH